MKKENIKRSLFFVLTLTLGILIGILIGNELLRKQITTPHEVVLTEFESMYGTKVSREDFIKKTRPMLSTQITKHRFDTIFPHLLHNDLEIILTTMMIIETSAQNEDGYWYPLNSELVPHNNLFGLKAHKNERYVLKNTFEIENGNRVNMTAKFKVFDSVEDCLIALMEKFQTERYARLRRSSTWATAFYNLKECGYMTDPNYPANAVKIVQTNNMDLN